MIFLEKMRNSVLNIPQIIFCRGRALSLPFLGQTRESAPTLNEMGASVGILVIGVIVGADPCVRPKKGRDRALPLQLGTKCCAPTI